MLSTDPVLSPLIRDQFSNLELIGRGFSADVFRAFDKAANERVALKLFKPEHQRLYELELNALQRLAGDGTVKLLDCNSNGSRPYLVLELHDTSMQKVLEQRGPLDALTALTIAYEVGTALRNAHARGIVHRDTTPKNILVNIDNAGRIWPIRLADWGSAVVDGVSVRSIEPRGGGRAVELFLSPLCDRIGLGRTLYRLLMATEPPFSSGLTPSPGASAGDPVAAMFQAVRSLPASVPDCVRHVLCDALNVLSGQGYESMSQMVVAIKEAHDRIAR